MNQTQDLIRFHAALNTLLETLPVVTGLGRRFGAPNVEELVELINTADMLWADINEYLGNFRLVAERVKRAEQR